MIDKKLHGLRRSAWIAALGLAVSHAAFAEVELMKNEEQGTKLVFNVDVLAAWYNSNESWFGSSESFLGANTDHWADVGIEPKLGFETSTGKGTIFAAVSGVYTSTAGEDASGLTIGTEDQQELTLEQGNMGWRTSDLVKGLENDTFTITGGRFDYNIGTGMLINDGGSDGGDRGGWYLGMRKAFSDAVLATLDSDTWKFEVFRLKNQPRDGGTAGEAYGANVEYKFNEDTTIGTTYMKVDSNLGDPKLDVYSVRAGWRGESGFGLAGEYADESSSQIEAEGYYGEVSYAASKMSWSPVFSYRYAHFSGDNLATPGVDERFHEIAYGYTDWGSWYQGEITGEYALGNGNLVSNMLRAKLTPKEDLTLNAMFYTFTLDRPASFGVLSDDWGDELNFTAEWQVNEHFLVIGVLGALFPGDGAKQFVGPGPGNDWIHGMLYLSYNW